MKNYTTQELMEEIIKRNTLSNPPKVRKYIGKWVEATIGIDDDNTAYFTMGTEAYDRLIEINRI